MNTQPQSFETNGTNGSYHVEMSDTVETPVVKTKAEERAERTARLDKIATILAMDLGMLHESNPDGVLNLRSFFKKHEGLDLTWQEATALYRKLGAPNKPRLAEALDALGCRKSIYVLGRGNIRIAKDSAEATADLEGDIAKAHRQMGILKDKAVRKMGEDGIPQDLVHSLAHTIKAFSDCERTIAPHLRLTSGTDTSSDDNDK